MIKYAKITPLVTEDKRGENRHFDTCLPGCAKSFIIWGLPQQRFPTCRWQMTQASY
jgi:hypothetical protein